MDFASLLVGISVISVAVGLESHRRLSQWSATDATELDLQYAARRKRVRQWTNGLFALLGLLAVTAGVIGPGFIWFGLWTAVPLVLLATVVLACWDFLHTERYLQKKIPEIRRETLRESGLEAAEAEQAAVSSDPNRS